MTNRATIATSEVYDAARVAFNESRADYDCCAAALETARVVLNSAHIDWDAASGVDRNDTDEDRDAQADVDDAKTRDAVVDDDVSIDSIIDKADEDDAKAD